jgi:quercetin dioxygenase-like cupin family protein
MASTGQVIENPVTGERFTFVQTAADTNGERMEFIVRIRPHAKAATEHVHPRQMERLTVAAGTLRVAVGGVERHLSAGESVDIAPGEAHTWSNDNETDVEVNFAFTPGLNSEEFFETFCALARDGRTDGDGVPSLLQIAVSAPHFDIWLARPPIWVQRALFAVLAPVARLLGYRPIYSARAPRLLVGEPAPRREERR